MVAVVDEAKISKSPKPFFAERNANQKQGEQRFAIPMKQPNKKKNAQKGKTKSNVAVNNKLDRRQGPTSQSTNFQLPHMQPQLSSEHLNKNNKKKTTSNRGTENYQHKLSKSMIIKERELRETFTKQRQKSDYNADIPQLPRKEINRLAKMRQSQQKSLHSNLPLQFSQRDREYPRNMTSHGEYHEDNDQNSMPKRQINILTKLEKMEEVDGYGDQLKKSNNRVKSMAQDQQIQIFQKQDVTPRRNKSKNLKAVQKSNNFLEINERKNFVIKMKFNEF